MSLLDTVDANAVPPHSSSMYLASIFPSFSEFFFLFCFILLRGGADATTSALGSARAGAGAGASSTSTARDESPTTSTILAKATTATPVSTNIPTLAKVLLEWPTSLALFNVDLVLANVMGVSCDSGIEAGGIVEGNEGTRLIHQICQHEALQRLERRATSAYLGAIHINIIQLSKAAKGG